MEYDKIVNPQTGRKCLVRSPIGRKVLKNYIFRQSGGNTNCKFNDKTSRCSVRKDGQPNDPKCEYNSDSKRCRKVTTPKAHVKKVTTSKAHVKKVSAPKAHAKKVTIPKAHVNSSQSGGNFSRIPMYMVHDFNSVKDDEFMVELRYGSSYADRKGPLKPELFMDKDAFNRLLTDEENDYELVKVYIKTSNGKFKEVGYYHTDEVEDYGVAWISINNDVFRHKQNYPEFWMTENQLTFVEKVRDWKTSELIDLKTAEERGLFDEDDEDDEDDD